MPSPVHGISEADDNSLASTQPPSKESSNSRQDSSTYKIPCSSDVPPDFRVALFTNSNREETIYRSKGVGEPPFMLGISVFAAIADALHSLAPGKPVPLDAPATAESIWRTAQELVNS